MRPGASGLLGFVAGVAITALVASLLIERGEGPAGEDGHPVAAVVDREPAPFARDAGPAPSAQRLDSNAADTARRDASSASADADDALGLIVYGVVRDASGAPVKVGWGDTASIGARPVSGSATWTEIEASGAYWLRNLKPGSWSLTADLPGFRPKQETLDLRPDVPVLRHDIVMQAAVVLVVKAFASDGRTLIDALNADLQGGMSWDRGARIAILATREELSVPFSYDRNAGQHFGVGTAVVKWDVLEDQVSRDPGIPGDAIGLVELDIDPPVWVSLVNGTAVLASQRVAPAQREVVFSLDVSDVLAVTASIDVRFVDLMSGSPLKDTRWIYTETDFGSASHDVNDEGRVHLDRVTPGPLRITGTPWEHEPFRLELELQPGERLDLGDVPLHSLRSVRGTVVDAQGLPRANTSVNLRMLDPDASRPFEDRWSNARTDGGGVFEFSAGWHRYAIAVDDDDLASEPVIVDTHVADATNLEIRAIRSGRATVFLDWPEDRQHGLRITNAEGLVHSDWLECTGQDYRYLSLVPGRFVIDVHDGATVLLTRPFEIGPTKLDLTLKP